MAKDLRFSVLLAYYGDLLTEKQAELVTGYYDLDLSLSEIAENEGITRQGVRDAIKRAEQQLLLFEQTLGLVKKTEELKKLGREAKQTGDITLLCDYIETM